MKTSILIINKLAPVCLYHLKRLQCLHNCLFLLLRAPWLSSILRLWQIEILSQFNTTFPFYPSNIEIRNLHPIIMLCNILLYLLISSLSTLRFGPRWAKVPWTFSASQPPLNPSRPCQVSHSHDASLRGVWTKGIPFQHSPSTETDPRQPPFPHDSRWQETSQGHE